MPTYEYRCSKCGFEFEEFQPISAQPIRKCPKCGRRAVNRLISAGAGILFRGSGFYETDYRSESYKTAAKKESDAGKPASEKSTAASTDGQAKPAAAKSSAAAKSEKSSAPKPAAAK